MLETKGNQRNDLLLFSNRAKANNPRSKILVTGSRRNLQERDGKNPGSGRNIAEVTGTWKQYSDRKISGFFPAHSDHFPALSARNLLEITGKKIPKIFRPESCFDIPMPRSNTHGRKRPVPLKFP